MHTFRPPSTTDWALHSHMTSSVEYFSRSCHRKYPLLNFIYFLMGCDSKKTNTFVISNCGLKGIGIKFGQTRYWRIMLFIYLLPQNFTYSLNLRSLP